MDTDIEPIVLDDEVEDTPVETTETDTPVVEDKPVEETTDEQILKAINAKGIKYNGNDVSVASLDELISTYQKGLNYDKHQTRENEEEEFILQYIRDKANSAGKTGKEYIEAVKHYEEEQKKAQIEKDAQEMIDNGITPEMAKKVAQLSALKDDIDRQRAELDKEKAELKAKADSEKEYEEFLKAYPEVKANEIPKEVFEDAKEIGLKAAYALYENKQIKEKLKQMEQSIKNASNSIVAASNGSPTEQSSSDAFSMGFDSVD